MTRTIRKRKTLQNRRRVLRLLLVSLLFLTGCPQPKLPPIQEPFPPLSDLTTETVSQLIDKRAASFKSLWGEGKIAIQNWEERYKFTENFMLQAPESFRLETQGFLNQPVIFLTSDGNLLSLYSKKHHTQYKGVASQKNLFKLSGINLSVENMLLVLSGNPPKLPQVTSEWGLEVSDSETPIERYFFLERISLPQKTIQRIRFDIQHRAVVGIDEYLLESGKLLLRVTFSDFRANVGEYPIPALIQIERPFDNIQVQIEYKSFVANQTLEQEFFSFEPSAGAKVLFLDDTANEQLERLAPFEEFRVKEESQ
ncbi:hypothetical protein CSA56_11415 [candidate division KSB3 bacterium]|uniref:DUF4292 domain-containing protein n=1 Tax=candidate division KSB3 bacterium TaxID=2044937 RepID=A0A2G6KCY8_9BACT|nr:MAG: hypothetical protein CSA56_11415 [candidate division KSB3 bacterium]